MKCPEWFLPLFGGLAAIGLLILLLVATKPPPTVPEPRDVTGSLLEAEEKPTDVVYRTMIDSGDCVPVQVVRLRSGATFFIVGTDTHGVPIIYTLNAEEWKRETDAKGLDADGR